MNFLKKYLTFHICALFGYATLIMGLCCIDIFNNLNLERLKSIIWFLTYPNPLNLMIYILFATYFYSFFIPIFTGEIILHKIIKKVFKKDLSINIKNKYYNIFFFIGLIFLCLILFPGTAIVSFYLLFSLIPNP